MRLVCGLAIFLVGGQVLAVAASAELWPFSHYPMYADASDSRSITLVRMVGVTVGKRPRELPLDAAWSRKALGALSRRAHPEKELTHAMRRYVGKYGWRRPDDSHARPPTLRALRVYEQQWIVLPDAANSQKPDRSRLLAEIVRDR